MSPKSHGVAIIDCDAEVRVGGRYRSVLRNETSECGPPGDLAFSGQYIEITPHTRLVYTQVFEPMQEAGEAIITVTFEEQDGKTRLVAHELYPSAEAHESRAGLGHGTRHARDVRSARRAGRIARANAGMTIHHSTADIRLRRTITGATMAAW